MGYELRRWLADRLPAKLSSGERLVALEIADQANEKTRRAYGKSVLEAVIRRTGYADGKQLGKVLGKLAANGVELRVPLRDRHGKPVVDKRGRTVYACNGHELNFYIPSTEECPALKVSQAGDQEPSGSSPDQGSMDGEAPPPGPEGPPVGAGSSPGWSPKVPQAGEPSPQSPQDSSSLSTPKEEPKEGEREDRQGEDQTPTPPPAVPGVSADLVERVMGATTATAEEFVRIVEAARRDGIRTPGPWLRSDAGAENFRDRLAALRSAPSAARFGPPDVGDYRAAVRAACEHGTPGGADRCPLCRRQVPAQPPVAEDQPLEVPKPRGGQEPAPERDRSGTPTSGRDTSIASVRARLAKLSTTDPVRRRTTPARFAQPSPAEVPSAVAAAHTYLSSCGDGLEWVENAREKLGGADASRDEVIVLAATLAHAHHDRMPAAR